MPVLACALMAAAAPPAYARWYGSLMRGALNANYGCESALIAGPLGGVHPAATGQGSCTYRHAGYLYSNRPTFMAPGIGRITAIKVKSGPRPAKLRLTILTGSSRVDTFTGFDVRDKRPRFRIHPSDGVALTAVGPGTVPLQIRNDVGVFNPDPRAADGYSMTGIDLMFQWYFKRR